MSINIRKLIPMFVSLPFLFACAYIVVPDVGESSAPKESKGWTGVVTNVGQSESGDLHIDITVRNETADWSTMQAIPGKAAVLTGGDGKNTDCNTLFISSGGHRLAPGFQMRGYVTGTLAEPKTQLLYVECAGAKAAAGMKLTIPITYVTGEFNYYYPDTNKVDGQIELSLDQVVTDLTYPIFAPVEGLVLKSNAEIIAMSDAVITLKGVERTEKGLTFSWNSYNPSDYALKSRIGTPPVIGEDGIIYGIYESPDMASSPTAPAKGTAEWTTEVAIPADIHGLYILMSVESKKMRLFVNYAVDITDK
jgi:hypothetical protein